MMNLPQNFLRHTIVLAVLTLSVAFVAPASGRDTRANIESLTAKIAGKELRVYRYDPHGCAEPSILMVFHGNGRSARSYLESSLGIADRGCFVVYAPLFDSDRFPSWSYHRGGLVHDGKLLPENEWTVEMAGDLLTWARTHEARPDALAFLFGHSAGAQYLSRVAAYALPDHVERIILANPSTYVLPDNSETVPYGYGGLPAAQAEAWRKAYLAAPVTIYLGDEDTGSKDLTMTAQAVRQGKNRVDRGERVFETAQQTASADGLEFNWTLVYAAKVAHSARGMLGADAMVEAMGFR